MQFEGQDFKGKQKSTVGIKWIAPPKRERKVGLFIYLLLLFIFIYFFAYLLFSYVFSFELDHEI